MALMERCGHPSLMTYKKIFFSNSVGRSGPRSFMGIEMDFANGGDITNFVRGLKVDHLDECDAGILIFQLACGVHYLHKVTKIIHRDIKPQNILIKITKEHPFPIVMLTDLGLSKIYQSQNQNNTFDIGTLLQSFK